MTFSLHPLAERDVAETLDFYSEQAGPVVAERFLEDFERVTKLLVEHPGLKTPKTRGQRTFPLKVFPYSVMYKNIHLKGVFPPGISGVYF